jgi:hypothetical protein
VAATRATVHDAPVGNEAIIPRHTLGTRSGEKMSGERLLRRDAAIIDGAVSAR